MTGLEYLTPDVLAGWWRDLDALVRGEIAKHPGGAQGYLRDATRCGGSSAASRSTSPRTSATRTTRSPSWPRTPAA